MSPTAFGLLVASTILVILIGIATLVVLGLRARGSLQLQRRLAPEQADDDRFEEVDRYSVLTSVARGGRKLEGLVDSDGESARLLLQADVRSTESRLVWYVFQGLLPVLVAVLVTLYWVLADTDKHRSLAILLSLTALVFTFLLPRWILRGMAAARQRRIKAEVPMLIHLLALLFEAGLSTRQALASLIREGSGVLPHIGRELELAIRQIEAGGDTAVVLKGVADNMGVDDLSTVLSVLRQVDRYGGEIREPLLETLEVLEERRSLDLRERVNLLSGRMTVIMVLFFFPALLVFVSGPAFLALIRALGEING
ncbi:MAG TPA: type II secretion system F family protein [Fontimonas sp.]